MEKSNEEILEETIEVSETGNFGEKIVDFLSAKLGRCTFCIKWSLIFTVFSWAIFTSSYFTSSPQSLQVGSLIAAIGFTLLLTSHLFSILMRSLFILDSQKGSHCACSLNIRTLLGGKSVCPTRSRTQNQEYVDCNDGECRICFYISHHQKIQCRPAVFKDRFRNFQNCVICERQKSYSWSVSKIGEDGTLRRLVDDTTTRNIDESTSTNRIFQVCVAPPIKLKVTVTEKLTCDCKNQIDSRPETAAVCTDTKSREFEVKNNCKVRAISNTR